VERAKNARKLGRPVAYLASFMAPSTASAPELVRRHGRNARHHPGRQPLGELDLAA